MYSENGVLVDLDDIAKLVSEADVFTIGFANFAERLIVDTRSDMRETPLVQVVEPAGSPRDRLAWLQRRRPSLGTPRAFSFMAWPHSPGFMQDTGVWERVRGRVKADSDLNMDSQCEQALRQLENLDFQASMAVLRGERCLTLWPREPEQR
jgi:hypothetical protein